MSWENILFIPVLRSWKHKEPKSSSIPGYKVQGQPQLHKETSKIKMLKILIILGIWIMDANDKIQGNLKDIASVCPRAQANESIQLDRWFGPIESHGGTFMDHLKSKEIKQVTDPKTP